MVDGTGQLTAAGGLRTGSGGDVIAGGGIESSGRTVLQRHRVARDPDAGVGERIELDVELGTFFEVPEDGKAGSVNFIRLLVSQDACSPSRSSHGQTHGHRYFGSHNLVQMENHMVNILSSSLNLKG